jgi:hypothetical protein
MLTTLTIILAGFLGSRPNTAAVRLVGDFNGQRAFDDLRHIVGFGPRPSGSQALERTRQFIIRGLRGAGIEVKEDRFTAATSVGPISMSNIIAKIPGTRPSTVIIGGHYETKRMGIPFVGANDGGSSTAFLMEMARVLARRANQLTYWVVFFDGEEAIKKWSSTDGLYGSRHLSASLGADGTLLRVRAVIVVDMIADAHLDIHRETLSTLWLNEIVFTQADRLGLGRFFLDRGRAVQDDHVPFLEHGLPAADIIDLDYGPLNLFWHSRLDTLDKCNPSSLALVGQVVIESLYALEGYRHLC